MGKANLKPIGESKVVGNLQQLSGNNDDTEWMEGLPNAMEQVRPGMGKLLRNICGFSTATTTKFYDG